jgi:hypothetical protein
VSHITNIYLSRAIFSRVYDEEVELLQWYSEAEAVAADVAASTQKMRAEYAAKATGRVASSATKIVAAAATAADSGSCANIYFRG